MSEQTMRSRLVLRCKDLDMKPIENKVARGTPDVNYVEGWLELKWLRGWPVKEGPVEIAHYSNHQRLWLKRRWERGGNVFLVLQVKKEWLLFAGCDALPVGTLTREELISIALAHWERDLYLAEFKQFITAERSELERIRKHLNICNSPLVKNFSLNAVGAAKRNTKQQRATRSAMTDTSNGSEDTPKSPGEWDTSWWKDPDDLDD